MTPPVSNIGAYMCCVKAGAYIYTKKMLTQQKECGLTIWSIVLHGYDAFRDSIVGERFGHSTFILRLFSVDIFFMCGFALIFNTFLCTIFKTFFA